jgi:hypothetical protein
MSLFRMSRVCACVALAIASISCYCQNSLANQTIKWDDYTFKFLSTGLSAQVFDSNGKVAGTILSMNGDLQVLPLPGTDQDKLRKSFADWKTFYARSHGPQGSSAATAASAPSPGSGDASMQCPSIYGVSYFDGSAWKTMQLAVELPRQKDVSVKQGFADMAKNPFSAMNGTAGRMVINRYKDPAAPLTVGTSPSFCVGIPANFNPSQIMIGTVDVKKDHREVEQAVSTRDSWLPPGRVQQVDIKRISDTVVEITPKSPLAPGQYVLGGPPMVGIYDFGVQAAR